MDFGDSGQPHHLRQLPARPWCSSGFTETEVGTWFSSHGGVGVTVVLGDLRGLFQP